MSERAYDLLSRGFAALTGAGLSTDSGIRDWLQEHASVAQRPDGDADLEGTEGFVVPACECGGVFKPDVVFFGENVPRDRVEVCFRAVEQAPALLVAGSSLTVMSGLRFVRAAVKWHEPVVIVNRGHTRADELASERIEAGTSQWLSELADATA